jgi:ParB-like chromosome segregation protein Spo0J
LRGPLMQIESIAISELRQDPANARRHPQRNIDAIMNSLARFGQQKPIVVDANNVVRAGNGTLVAAKALGWTEVRVVRTALASVDATAFGIADNRTSELAEWDNEVLAQLLREAELGDVGFNSTEIRDLTGHAAPAPPEPRWSEQFQVVVDCDDEAAQKALYERLTAEGFDCRVLQS